MLSKKLDIGCSLRDTNSPPDWGFSKRRQLVMEAILAVLRFLGVCEADNDGGPFPGCAPDNDGGPFPK